MRSFIKFYGMDPEINIKIADRHTYLRTIQSSQRTRKNRLCISKKLIKHKEKISPFFNICVNCTWQQEEIVYC